MQCRKATHVMLAVCLLLVTAAPAIAESPWPEYTDAATADVFPADMADEMELLARSRHTEYLAAIEAGDSETSKRGENPGVGSTQVIVHRWASGYLYEDDAESGIAIIIWDIVLTIVSYFTTTAGSIMLDVADLFDDLVDRSIPAMSKIYHSYSYPDKLAQVWTSSQHWETFFTSEAREWFRHEWASYATTAGTTRAEFRNFHLEDGYGPIHGQYGSHYSDHTYLMLEAYTRWLYGYPPGREYAY